MHKIVHVKSEIIFPMINEILANEGHVSITVTGNSMHPFLRSNKDTVELSKANYADIRPYDIVLVLRDNGQYVLHRIVRKGGKSFYIIGDAHQNIEGPLHHDQIVAVAVAIQRRGKRIKCSSLRWRFVSFLWVKLIPYRYKILKSYRRIRNLFKKY